MPTDERLSLTDLEALERCGMEKRLLLNRHRLNCTFRSCFIANNFRFLPHKAPSL
jgi:hypothetical protein